MTAIVLDQLPIPLTNNGNSELLIQSTAVTGGTLYSAIARSAGNPEAISGVGVTFVPSSVGGIVRNLPLTNAKADTGVSLTATATGGAVGVKRTAGTSLTLDGEVTSSSASTDKALWEFSLPDSYVAGSAIAVTVNQNYSGSGTITGGSTTMALAAYTEINGVEAAIGGVTAAIGMTPTATGLVFTVPGTGLVPGQRLVFELTMVVTTASGANTGHINSVSYVA